ncbi:Ig-like domain-containing protein [Nocardioides sp. J2M5]|uniref:peroxidase family protein n=1 Tax=Nocardioides palaemonis TaxID=2829810 RepID=UPI001BAB1AC2|nr:peroxidase family protein [Nocardioides palaemonis]MBS2938848.1 Ig-like domain-containing protein [Nocardioides palaemonis]
MDRTPQHTRTYRRTACLAVLSVVAALGALLPAAPPAGAAGVVGAGFTVSKGDLTFILRQIRISERHANTLTAADPCGTLVGSGPNQIPDRLTSYGLRTVDGSCNNLFPGRSRWGSADQVFPRLVDPTFREAEGIDAGALFPGSPGKDASSYAQKTGSVYDSQPRLVSNLVVDQTATNPAAVAAAGNPVRTQGNSGVVPCQPGGDPSEADPDGTPDGCVGAGGTLFIPNVTTDVGLSPPYNSTFTFFGQFFDHGVDQTVKGGATVFVPLAADDPLRTLGPDGKAGTGDELGSGPQFMAITRAKNQPGPDGQMGTADDVQDADNTDSPWVDQSQTYSSHAAHQVYLREYELTDPGPDGVLHDDPTTDGVDEGADDTDPVSTGRLLGGLGAGETYAGSPDGRTGMASWASTKQQAARELGLQLVDTDVLDVPALLTDPYGQFVPGPAGGFPQYVCTPNGGDCPESGLVEGDPTADGGRGVRPPSSVRHFQTPFLTDIAHAADPSPVDADHNPGTPAVPAVPDADDTAGSSTDPVAPGEYDDELLASHFIAGDGRVNENIALSFVHQVFHSEHDRLVADIDATLHQPGNESLLAGFATTAPPEGAGAGARAWSYGDRLFQAARFVNEMEYQHLVFEEFARKMVPAIHPFHVYSPDVDPAVDAEFAHAVYRFGHSMLDDVVARRYNGVDHDEFLLDAFLNPPMYFDSGDPAHPWTPEQAAGAIAMGSADQVGNEIDEFVTRTLRSNLLGLPLDLAALNMARARDAGVPRLNEVRRELHARTNDPSLAPYESWADFGNHLKHPESLVNFVAAYGTHPTITAATTLAGKRAAARALVDPQPGDTPPADAASFMFSTDSTQLTACQEPDAGCGDWSSTAAGRSATGVDDVDLWVGGLAEVTNLFGGLLGSTFTYVFQTQMEKLQDNDRLYYLARTPGLNLRTQLEGNSFTEIIQRNTDGTSALKADAFGTADCHFLLEHLAGTAAGFAQSGSTVADDPATPDCKENLLLVRNPDGTIAYRTRNTVDPSGINGQSVYEGTPGVDRVNGGNDNDTFWGGEGNDRIEGNGGDDVALGGLGDDIITDLDGADMHRGGPGDDAIDSGPGDDLAFAGDGQDVVNGGLNDNETFGGEGDDFIIAGNGADAVFGDGGNDWIQGGNGQDLLMGDHGAPFFDDPGEPQPGHDVFVGQPGENDYDAEGGDDIMSQNAAIDRNAGAGGFDWATHQYDTVGADDDMLINQVLAGQPLPVVVNRDRWAEMEANSGSALDDVIRGDDEFPAAVQGGGFTGCDALDAAGLARIPGLDAIVPPLSDLDVAAVTLPGGGGVPARLTGADLGAGAFTGSCPLEGDIWGDGNILVGGAGSDTLEGRGGNDVIDGDRALEVRISVLDGPASNPASAEIGSTDLLEHQALTGTFGAGTAGRTLQQAVFAGLVDPGNLRIGRRIVVPASPGAVDTAVFSSVRSDYTIVPNANGSITVADNRTAARNDGTDTVRNVEQLRFSDRTVQLTTPPSPTGVTAVAGNASATVSWTDPASTSLFPVSEHRIQVVVGGSVQRTVGQITGGARSAVVSGLTNGTTYTFRVISVNAVGESAPSAESGPVVPANPLPRLVSTTPAASATGVSASADQVGVFDRSVSSPSWTSAVQLRNTATGALVGRVVTYIDATRTVTVNPNANLAAGTTYTLTFLGTGANAIRDAAGNLLPTTSITFTTASDATPPVVVSSTPADGATGVGLGANTVVNLSERVVGASTSTVVLTNVASGATVSSAVTVNTAGTRITVNPVPSLTRNTLYRVTLTGGAGAIRDALGNPLATTTITFRTRP